ncbi:hypothetical protein Xmau_03461 [Xenorhabdus mauleonii]|uniref:Uncharacterized protein n=1 Tax=Xenorhabdus mauleonii TaxID=351675 RepID=A0A1I3VRF4_9GAMM|nr:hypothetical protein [Xenorhabdus mauleonii]PHM38403.1 hypothetical protein Xmau_03461 [Xenorhabdus mauleonii]SFJ97719.1 hypothetical protein SAMN05421680_12230 [Xenorhabdus mauleonii]
MIVDKILELNELDNDEKIKEIFNTKSFGHKYIPGNLLERFYNWTHFKEAISGIVSLASGAISASLFYSSDFCVLIPKFWAKNNINNTTFSSSSITTPSISNSSNAGLTTPSSIINSTLAGLKNTLYTTSSTLNNTLSDLNSYTNNTRRNSPYLYERCNIPLSDRTESMPSISTTAVIVGVFAFIALVTALIFLFISCCYKKNSL